MRPFRHVCFPLLGLAALGVFPEGAGAQVPLSPRALGMGGAYVAAARGYESVFFNPANLGLSGTPRWSVAFPQVTAGASVLGPDVTDLQDFANYDDLSPQERDDLLAEIPESGTSLDVDVRAPVFALQVGNFNIGASYGFMGEHTVDKDLVELFFEGYEWPRTDYTIQNTRGQRATFWDFAVGYGRQVGPVSVGVAGHYYLGQSLVQTSAFFDPQQDIDFLGRSIEVDYVGVASEGGSGFGLDVGVAMQPVAGLTLSAAVANLVSSMDWKEELTGRSITLTDEDFEAGDPMVIEDRYEQSEQDIGASPTGQFGTVASGLFDAQTFPATLRLGAAWNPLRFVNVSAAYQNRLGEGRLLGRWEQQLGFGVELGGRSLALRAGASTNMDEGSILGAGLRLGVLDVGVARFRTAGTLDADADRDGLMASFSVNVRTGAMLR